MCALPKTKMNADEFLVWAPSDHKRWQLVDGEPQAMAPPNRTHGAIQGELIRLIGNHLMERGSPCSVIGTPVPSMGVLMA